MKGLCIVLEISGISSMIWVIWWGVCVLGMVVGNGYVLFICSFEISVLLMILFIMWMIYFISVMKRGICWIVYVLVRVGVGGSVILLINVRI